MDLRTLRLYLAVLEHGSITKASESVNVAQPALGMHMRKLEDELGLQLLLRHSRGVSATEAGALLAKHAKVMLRYMDRTKDELSQYAKVPSGSVTIGLSSTAREVVAVALMERLSRELPSVQLKVKEARSEILVEDLIDGRVDAALVRNSSEGGDQLVFEPLASESMYFVYPLAQGRREGDSISLADAINYRLIVPMRPHQIRTEIDRVAASVGVEPKIVHEIDSLAARRDFVSCGLGCSIMPRGASMNFAYSGTVGSQRLVDPQIKRLLFLAYSRRRSTAKSFEATLAMIRAVVEDELSRADGQWQRLEPLIRIVRPAVAGLEASSAHR